MATLFMIWASSLALMAWQCAGARRQHAADQKNRALRPSGPKFIEGIPVYNYHRAEARQGDQTISLVELGPDATEWEVNWNVFMKKTATRDEMDSLCKRAAHGCLFMGNVERGGLPVLRLRLSEQRLEAILKEGGSQSVRFVEPDLLQFAIPDKPEDDDDYEDEDEGEGEDAEGDAKKRGTGPLPASSKPAPVTSWGLQRIGVSASGLTGRGVNVYVVDTGVHTTHLDLEDRATPAFEVNDTIQWECKGDLNCAVDVHGHGTHCAGTIAGATYGIAPGARIHGVKVLDSRGRGMSSWTLVALDWVKVNGARPAVVSMSLGGEGTSEAEKAAIDELTEAGVAVVVAAGNEADDACNYSPAFVPSAITVGATNRADMRAYYSNMGKCVDLFAPGSNIISLSNKGDNLVAKKSGTSMACPHVSGAVALIFEEIGHESTVSQVKERLMATAEEGKLDTRYLSPSCPNKLLHVARSEKMLVMNKQDCAEYFAMHFENCGCDCACEMTCAVPGGAYLLVCEAWFGVGARTAEQCKMAVGLIYDQIGQSANVSKDLKEGQCVARGHQACDALEAVAVADADEVLR